MTVLALQNRVKKNITLIEDKLVLEKINQLIDESYNVYVLSDVQLQMLREADEDLKNGNFIDGDEMELRVAKWLSER
jgi:hypothetical protein